jgi:hypothetical protein
MSTEQNPTLSRRRYFWAQLALLTAGIVGLSAAHRVASWDADNASVAFRTAVLVGVALAAVARSTSVIVTSAVSDAYRVFRSRHLLACAALLGSAAVVACSPILHGPFGRVLAHGRITGEDIADLGSVLAAFVCTVGAVVAAGGAWEALRDERHWYRAIHRGHRPL